MCWFMLWHSGWSCSSLGITSLYQKNWGGKRLGIHSASSLDFMAPGCILHFSVFLLPEKIWKSHVAMLPASSEQIPDCWGPLAHLLTATGDLQLPFLRNSRQVNGCYWRLLKRWRDAQRMEGIYSQWVNHGTGFHVLGFNASTSAELVLVCCLFPCLWNKARSFAPALRQNICGWKAKQIL